MRILIQLPEGLKPKALHFAEKYINEGDEVFFSCSPCFGACDLAVEEAKTIKADKLVHIGHNKFGEVDIGIKVEYVPHRVDVDVSDLVEKLKQFKGKKIALATTVQHSHQVQLIKSECEKSGIPILTSRGVLTKEESQVLGCDSNAVKNIEKESDIILYVGDGMFHPTGIKAEKPIYAYNPYTKSIENITEKVKSFLNRRKGALAQALTSNSFGILVSSKVGQSFPSVAERIKKELESLGKKAYVFVSNTFDPYSLANFSFVECYINTACPRISDDVELYGKPILDLSLYREFINLVSRK